MSFIGQSKDETKPLGMYLCLERDDCEMMIKAVETINNKAMKQYAKWRDIHDGGEMTLAQQNAMSRAEERKERIDTLMYFMKKYMKGGE